MVGKAEILCVLIEMMFKVLTSLYLLAELGKTWFAVHQQTQAGTFLEVSFS